MKAPPSESGMITMLTECRRSERGSQAAGVWPLLWRLSGVAAARRFRESGVSSVLLGDGSANYSVLWVKGGASRRDF